MTQKEVKPARVLVSSREEHLYGFLKQHLPRSRFSVAFAEPGGQFLKIARHEHPEIAVIDCVPERAEAVQMEIAVLRDIQPEIRIIAVSPKSTEEDAKVIEQGVFYYTTAPAAEELVLVIEAAARSISLKVKHSGKNSKEEL